MNVQKPSIDPARPATELLSSVFRRVSDLENEIHRIMGVLQALNRMAESDPDDGSSIMTLCNYALHETKEIERVRCEIFHETHRFAYPDRGSSPERANG